jgi:signal transduction histidine kinase/CheY-like chemotaxis protein
MVFNKATLAFPDMNEALFRTKYYADSVIQFRVAFLLVTILYAAFGYLDSRMVPEYAEFFQAIRFYFVVPLLLIVFLLSFTGFFRKVWQALLFLSFLVGGVGISIMTMLVPENYAYYAGMMLIFSAGYFFIKLRFLMATIAGWTTLLIFNLGAVFYAHTPGVIILSNNFFFISANLIGMFAAYNIEYYTRRDFYLNQELDRQKGIVENANKNLEKTVEVRTKELVEAKNKAEQSDRLKTAFLNNISHEIRTPLNGILGFSEMLVDPGLPQDEKKQYLAIVKANSNRLMNTVTDFLDMSLIASGSQEVRKKIFAIDDLLAEVYKKFIQSCQAKNLIFMAQLPPAEARLFINSDRELLRTVLCHLVDNAVKFTKQGTVSFGFEVKGNEAEFYVNDTGTGINQELQATIFDKFMQEDIANTRGHEGSGLGLSIVKGIVELLGGRIWLESEKGKGSSFFFKLPVEIVSDGKPAIKAKPGSSAIQPLILIVEDEESGSLLLKRILDKEGFDSLVVFDGLQAVDNCRQNPRISLVLMDLKMPVMSGFEATRVIKSFRPELPVIAITAYALSGDENRALEAGCDDYIAKPIGLDILLEKIKRYNTLT